MTHGEKQGLAALAIVLALILGAIWWSNRPTAAPVPAEMPPVAASATDSATVYPDSAATPDTAKPSPRKRSRRSPGRSPAPADRPSPLDRPN